MHLKNRLFSVIFVILFVGILQSCAATTLKKVWKDPGYSGKIKKIFVIGVSEKQHVRTIFEKEFVNQLKPFYIEGVPSYFVLGAQKMLDKETIVSKIQGEEIDAVLITRLVGQDTKTIYNHNWYGHYSASYDNARKKRVYTDEILNLETNLYDVRTEKLIWSAVSSTYLLDDPSTSIPKEIQSFIKLMIKNLSEEKLI